MQRTHWGMLGGLIAMGGAAGFLLTVRSPAFQGPDPTLPLAAPAVAQGNAKLPIGKVALFSSGVGYFERSGSIDNDAIVELSFPSTDINDLLKSMMVRDLGGGQVETVSLDSTAPLDKTLSSFAIDLQGRPGFGQILEQARGEKVEVILTSGQGNANTRVNGTIIGLETKKEAAGANVPPIDKEYLILNTDDGIRNLSLAQFVMVRFSDPTLEAELKKALDALGRARDNRKKTVALKFTGKGQRVAKVSYVTESPIWKTSYRLVFDDKENPTLLGWAVVENPTDDDWTNVKLSLVSGRPMSFRMDLWQSLYVDRPLVEPELFKSLRPVAYGGDLSRQKANLPPAAAPGMGGLGGLGGVGGLGGGGMGGGFGGGLGGAGAGQLGGNIGTPPGPGVANPGGNYFGQGVPLADSKDESLTQGVKSMALAKELGQAFEYQIKNPISLSRRKSALIPIIGAQVAAEKVSIYNPNVHPKYPLLGLKLTNGTGGNLVQGPITVFEGGAYAGDGRIMDLEPNEKRFLSYAVDLGVEVKSQTFRSSRDGSAGAEEAGALGNRLQDRPLVSVSLARGVAILKVRDKMTTEYTIVNRSSKPRKMILEETIVQDGEEKWNLVESPKPEETTAELYRFAAQAEAGKSVEVKIIQERISSETVKLIDMSFEQLQELVRARSVSPAVKQALEKIQTMRNDWRKAEVACNEAEIKVATIFKDQQRLRANLKELPPTSEAYKRYLTKFDQQEPQLEALQLEVATLRQTELKVKQAYNDYMASLEIK